MGELTKAVSFSGSMTGLLPGTLYYFRAYATNEGGTGYGGTHSFTTSSTSSQILTDPMTSITASTARGSGYIEVASGITLSQYGQCWSKSSPPTTADFCTEEGSATKTVSFTSYLTGLNSGTTYYVRTYAVSGTTTAYGNEVSFTAATYATVTTEAVTDITATTAIGNGTISSLGSPSPTEHGVCWNTAGSPDRADNCTEDGPVAATGAFTSAITGLVNGTTYYVRAYATNSAGTRYGNEETFVAGADAKFKWIMFLPAIY
jgi:hypothetical protein